MVEFSLSFLMLLGLVLGFAQMAIAVWVKTTLHHAVREGVRFGITGETIGANGHDASIRQVVMDESVGLIDAAQAPSLITIEYRDSQGNPSLNNTGGNTLILSVADYPVPLLAATAVSLVPTGMTVSVSAVDRLEPFPTAPPR